MTNLLANPPLLTTVTAQPGDVPDGNEIGTPGTPIATLGVQEYTFVTEPLTGPDGVTIGNPISTVFVNPRATIDVTSFHTADLRRLFSTRVDHPLTGDEIRTQGPGSGLTVGAGLQHNDILYTMQLPFGSFTPGQPAATIDFEARLDPDEGAVVYNDVGDRSDFELSVRSVGGFLFGNDPFDNPSIDPRIDGSTVSEGSVVPQVIELVKDGPEEFVQPGPSFPNVYDLYIDVAAGETLENLRVDDFIPDSLVYVPNSIIVEYRNGSQVGTLRIEQPGGLDASGGYTAQQLLDFVNNDTPNAPGGDLILTWESFTAVDNINADGEYDSSLENDFAFGTGARSGGQFNSPTGNGTQQNHPRLEDHRRSVNWDIHVRYEAYAPEFQASGAANVAGTEADNDAVLTATYNGETVVDNDTFENGHDDDRLDSDYSDVEVGGLGISKDVANVYDANGNRVDRSVSGVSGESVIPGDIIEYQINMSMSDFLAIDNLAIEDFLSDGQNYFENTSLLVGGTPLEGTSSFQTYIAVQSKGIGDDATILGSFNQSTGQVESVVPFGAPELYTDLEIVDDSDLSNIIWSGIDSTGTRVNIGNIANYDATD
ncbi:MAG: hypothetical protein AAF226_13500, partial [Verrucomicrobiota bacterium]